LEAPSGFETLDRRAYGRAAITLLRRA